MGSPVSPAQGASEQHFATHQFSNQRLSPAARPDISVANGDTNAGHPWCNNRPIDGDNGGVMGMSSWPPLSESTRHVRPDPEGFASSPQVNMEDSLPSQPLQRQTTAHSPSSSSANNPTRPRLKNRGGGSSGSGPPHNTFHRSTPPTPPPFPGFDSSYQPSTSMPYTPRPGVGSSRRGNQNSYGGVRSHQDRRGFNVPPPYMPHPPMGFMPPPPLPPSVPSFMAQPPVGFFPGQGFEMASPFMYMPHLLPPEPFRPMSIVPPPPPPMLFHPASENSLTNRIIKQINYYFSDDNLAKDNYLRSKMDDQGWVPIRLIASFHRVEQLTKDIPLIIDALRQSHVLELQGENIRSVTWQKWLRPSPSNTTVTPVSPLTDDSRNHNMDNKNDVQG